MEEVAESLEERLQQVAELDWVCAVTLLTPEVMFDAPPADNGNPTDKSKEKFLSGFLESSLRDKDFRKSSGVAEEGTFFKLISLFATNIQQK